MSLYLLIQVEEIDVARKQLFAQGSRTIDRVPPTKAALQQHIKRATYQAGHVWSQCLATVPELPSPGEWGWKQDGEHWTPHWTDLPEASKHCTELIHCRCNPEKGCTRRCKCKASNLPCTELCKCQGACSQD